MLHKYIYHWDVTKHAVFVFQNSNCQSIPLRIPQRGKKCYFFMLCYISGICYICGLKTEYDYILLMNFPPHILSKWIEHSLHLRKRQMWISKRPWTPCTNYTDLTVIPESPSPLASLPLHYFFVVLQSTNCFVLLMTSIWIFFKFIS